MDFNRRILPYYMTYTGPYGTRCEDTVLRDMDYLQQFYPTDVKRYQRKVADILDKMDYEGSMIYDEYPDRYCLERLAGNIVMVMKQEEAEQRGENPSTPEKWSMVGDMVLVLLYNEVYKRRHGGRRGFIKF